MFNKLLSNMKGGAKKSDDDDDLVEEAVESEKGGEDEEKKKKKSMIIKVVVIIGLAYLALDSFMNPENTQPEVVATPVIKKRKKPKKDPKKEEEKKEAEKKEEAKPGDTKVADTAKSDTPAATPEASPVPAVENINVEKSLKDAQAPAPETSAEKPPVAPAEPAADLAKNSTHNPEMDKAIGDLSATVNPSENPTAPTTPAVPANQEVKAETPVATTETATPVAPAPETPAPVTPAENEATAENQPTAVPAFNEPYAPPPNYEELGRGLVYNCKEGHWSCVSRLAYVACNKNTQWSRGAGKTPECVVQNIYRTDDDCTKIQRYYVANNKETTFCK